MATYKINTNNKTNNVSKMIAQQQAKNNPAPTPVSTPQPVAIRESVSNSGLGKGTPVSSSSNNSYSTPSYSTPTQSSGGTVQIKNPTTGAYMTVKEGSATHQNYLKNNSSAIAAPSAKDTASFNLNNLSGNSGVLHNGLPVTHQEAMAVNPLHAVNGNREALIQDAVKSGNWTNYNNWSAQQDPLGYDKGADGNYTQNKNYYAQLIGSDYDAMMNARNSGDTFTAGEWERTLKERVEKYNNAPGMASYIPRIHDSGHGQGNMYGIMDYDSNYMNSVYNQGSTGFKPHENTSAGWMNGEYAQNDYLQQWLINNYADDGMLGQHWSTNAVFQDQNLLNSAMSASGSYGDAEQQAVRQAINAQGMQQLSAPQMQAQSQPMSTNYSQQQSQFDMMLAQQQAQALAQQQAMAEMAKQLEAQKNQNNYNKSELDNIPIAPMGNPLEHVYAPGQSANQGGYVDNQLITNETFHKYLQDIYKGGF